MTKGKKYHLGDLIAKHDENKISSQEQWLLDDFMKKEFDTVSWNADELGDKSAAYATIYKNSVRKSSSINFRNCYKYAVAAVLLILLSVGLILRSTETSVEMLTFQTQAVSDSIKLSDGSVIHLAAHSSLRYPKHFEGGLRSVELQKGNAFFKVSKDPEHPFVIASREISTRVLGTSFHISIRKDECRVTVVTGKVKVFSAGQEVDLMPNEEALYAGSGLRKQEANKAFLYNWYEKDVELNNVSVRKVLTLLNYKYGACFKAEKDEILDTKMTIYIKGDLSLQNILDQITYITHLKFHMHDKTIDITL